MVHMTRSGAQWSPWEFDHLEDVDVFQSRVSLAPYRAQAIDAANSCEAAAEECANDDTDDDEDAWEDDALRLPPPCPLSSPPSKPYPSLPPTVPPPPSLTARKRHQKTGKKLQRSRARVATAQANAFRPVPKTKHSHTYSEGVAHVLPIKASRLGSSSGGHWVDPQAKKLWVSRGRLLCGLARYLPKLYRHQRDVMKGLLVDQPDLQLPFNNSIFPTVTFNLGLNVVTPEHLDMLNNAYGMCTVTSAGKFDHMHGGHIYMKQLKTVCEFPSGSTILLLSATCEHGNTPIQNGETRYLMTQHVAGGLFRWVAYGYQSAASLLAEPGGTACKEKIDGAPGEHVEFALGLLSKAEELQADRQEVFGQDG
ncbi:hypothetical protein K438DRAFT_1881670 [Mycena galopus ATCC 62051]|nr:hypothetical protein K438DRAFT_1881670 [Mycena galopus ATCC 62051]